MTVLLKLSARTVKFIAIYSQTMYDRTGGFFAPLFWQKEYTALVNDSNLLSVVILCKSSKRN